MGRTSRIVLLCLLGLGPLLLSRCDGRPVIVVEVRGLEENPNITQLSLQARVGAVRLSPPPFGVVSERPIVLPSGASGPLKVRLEALRGDGCVIAGGEETIDLDGASGARVVVPLAHRVCNDACLCWENPTPQGDTLLGVWGSAPDNVWVVGAGGSIRRWNGSSWDPKVPPPTEDTLVGVWGSGPRSVWAIGLRGTILHFDGYRWRVVRATLGFNASTDPAYLDIWGSGADNAWIVGSQGTLLRLSGDRWIPVPGPAASELLLAVSGSGTEEIWAVGVKLSGMNAVPTAWRRRDGVWAPAMGPALDGIPFPHRLLYEVYVQRPGEVWILGGGTQSLSPDLLVPTKGVLFRQRAGGAFVEQPLPAAMLPRLLSGRPGEEPALVGVTFGGQPGAAVPVEVLRFSGGRFAAVASWSAPGLPMGFLAPDATSFFAVGFGGTAWSDKRKEPAGPTRSLRRLWAAGGDDVWAVGDGGTLLHYEGVRWREVRPEVRRAQAQLELKDVFGLRSDRVFAVGRYGGPAPEGAILSYDGQRWRPDDSGLDLKDVALLGIGGHGQGEELWAAGERGDNKGGVLLQRGAMAGWRLDPRAPQQDRFTALRTAGTDLILSGVRGGSPAVFARRPGEAAWRDLLLGPLPGVELRGLSGPSAQDLFAVGLRYQDGNTRKDVAESIILRHTATWQEEHVRYPTVTLEDVSGTSSGELWVGGHGCSGSTLLRRSAAGWEQVPVDTGNKILGVGSAGKDDVWIAGEQGMLLHRRFLR